MCIKNKGRVLFFIAFILLHSNLLTQYLSNPSFEGESGFEIIPPGWSVCDSQSTPDTGPVNLLFTNQTASDGDTYLVMVTRGPNDIFTLENENIQTRLINPLLKGQCYDISIDLALSNTMIIGASPNSISYVNPIKLSIFGSDENCTEIELLYETKPVHNVDWQTFEFTILPAQNNYQFVRLEVNYDSKEAYFGNMMIDNFQLTTKETIVIKKLDTVVTTGKHKILNASPGTNYSWIPETGLSCSNCKSPDLNISYSKSYTCDFLDLIGCPVKELFNVSIKIHVPNVFTPNNDGINDFFHVTGIFPNSKIWIFNRQGSLIYKSNNYQNNWNGKNQHGTEIPSDTYWYKIIMPDNQLEYNGYVYLKK